MRGLGRVGIVSLAAVVAGAAAPAALADIRYANPTSAVDTGDCADPTPGCTLKHAVEGAVEGDEVIVLPGTHSIATGVNTSTAVDVHGEAGSPRPAVTAATGMTDAVLAATNPFAEIRRLDVSSDQNPLGVEAVRAAGTLEGVVVSSDTGSALALLPGTEVANSVARATAANAVAITNLSVLGPGLDPTTELHNVTAISSAPDGIGLLGQRFGIPVIGCFEAGSDVEVTNSILAAGGSDLKQDGAVLCGTPTATATLTHSNFDPPPPEDWASDEITYGPGNQDDPAQTDPESIFVDPPEDPHQLATAPTIDAGEPGGTIGTLDIDGDPRALGGAPDIGADEFTGQPETTITAKPKRKQLRKRRARFKFSSDEAGAGFECSLDDRAFAACDSPQRYKRLKKGKHRFRVRAITETGIPDPTPAEAKFKVKKKKRKR